MERNAGQDAGLCQDGHVSRVAVVSIANKSLVDNFRRAGRVVPSPSKVSTTWKDVVGTGKATFPIPFSELIPLQGLLDSGHDVLLVTLGSECVPMGGSGFAKGAEGTHAEYLRAFVSDHYGPKAVECQFVSLGRDYTLVNKSPDVQEIRAAIMHLAAQLDRDLTQKGYVLVANAIGGSNEIGDALKHAGRLLGWDMEGLPPLGPPAERALVAHQWGVARSLVDEVASVIDTERHAAVTVDRALTVHNAIDVAAEEGVLAFVAPCHTDAGPTLQMSALGMTLFDRVSRSGRNYFSATRRLLEGARGGAGEAEAGRLGELLALWARADLFGSNQVSELVAHGESHCETVDRNVAAITRPLLGAGILRPKDVFDLAVAAWLHDWGHSAAAFSDDAKIASVTGSSDIRKVHGVLSRERLRLAASGLRPDERHIPGLIIAHHQGWTSINDSVPRGDAPLIGSDHVRSLTDDIRDAGLKPIDAAQVPLLVAIFRVADAADVGLHRAFYRAVLADRLMDEFSIELERTARRNPEMPPSAVTQWRKSVRGALYKDENLDPLPSDPAPWDKSLHEWATHCIEQHKYFATHEEVLGVHLEMRAVGDRSWQLVPLVTPTFGAHVDSAVRSVATDIFRELGHVVKQDARGRLTHETDPEAPNKYRVRDLLERAGVSVQLARSA